MKVAITSDHAGFELKQKIRLNLESLGFGILDLGPSTQPVDYPDYGKQWLINIKGHMIEELHCVEQG